MALEKELEKVLLSQQHLLQVLVVVQTQVPEMELKQEQELQVWQVQEVILVKCVLADCSYSSSRSRIVVCVPVPNIQKQMIFAQSMKYKASNYSKLFISMICNAGHLA